MVPGYKTAKSNELATRTGIALGLLMKFDYVLVGGGTSACVLASQLVDRALGTVAIIESGSAPLGPRISTPVRYPETFATHWDYGLRTEPQSELVHRRLAWPRGKMLGGSSGINAMIYVPPCHEDMKSWPVAWAFDKIAASLHAIESRLFASDNFAGDYIQPDIHPLSQCFLKAISEYSQEELQDNHRLDIETPKISPIRFRRTQSNGRRRTAYNVFLKPLLDHPKLTIIENAHASRVLLDGTRARTVEFERNGENHAIEARVAVVLTAGSVFSPAILMRSGIGSRDLLKEHSIDTRLNLPRVGKNLQDHLIVPLVFESSNQPSLEKNFSKATRLEYLSSRTGAKSSNIAEVGAFLKLSSSEFPDLDNRAAQNIQLHFTPTHYLEYPTRKSPIDAWTIGITQSNPLSRGEVRLARNDASNCGVSINPKYLDEQFDLRVLVSAIRQVLPIAQQPALLNVLGSSLIPKGLVGTGGSQDSLDKQLEKLVRRYAMTLYHPVGTCAIGDDDQAVVDDRLRVRGADNLYVADSSIIPQLPIGNPQSFAMLIGYKAAKILEGDEA